MAPDTPPRVAGLGGSVKPTLLAFHGSGSNATVHTVQLARLMRVIKDHFEVESLEGVYYTIPFTFLLHTLALEKARNSDEYPSAVPLSSWSRRPPFLRRLRSFQTLDAIHCHHLRHEDRKLNKRHDTRSRRSCPYYRPAHQL